MKPRTQALLLVLVLVAGLALLAACGAVPTTTQAPASSGDLLADLSRALKAVFGK